MKEELLAFLKHPVYVPYVDMTGAEKKNIFVKLLIIALFFSFFLGTISGFITTFIDADLGKHGMDKLLEKYNSYTIFFLAVIVAPILEELLFRGPLVFFKNSSYFKYIFYLSAILFGAVHITNFESYATIIWLAPLLIAPQIAAGFFLGFIRVKLHLGWSMLLHAAHNGILIIPLLLFKVISPTI